MKKILALTLAAVMTAGMSTVAFADHEETVPVIGIQPNSADAMWTNGYMHLIDEDGDASEVLSGKDVELKGGDQVAIPILMWTDNTPKEDDKISSGDVTDWYFTKNSVDYNEEPSVWDDLDNDAIVDVKPVDYTAKKGLQGRIWSVVITLPENDSDKVAELEGSIKVGTTKNRARNSEYTYEVNLSYAPDAKSVTTIDGNETLDIGDTGIVKFEKDLGEIDLEFGDQAMFTVDVTGQGRLNLSWNTDFDKEFAAMYDYANLDFLTFSGEPSFNRNGYLYIFADEDAFVYGKGTDGAVDIGAEWDEDMEAWRIRTRDLTSYVISDVELDEKTVTDTDDSSSTTDGGKVNPDTGR